jgi:predicted nucleotide-binding protein
VARKPTGSKAMDDSTKGPLELKVTHEEAFTKLQIRIGDGHKLISSEVSSQENYEQLKVSTLKWNDYNKLLLLNLFTTSEISDEYVRPVPASFVMSGDWRQSYEHFLKALGTRITRLESVVGRLELIPVASTVDPQQTQMEVPKIAKPKAVFIGHGRSKLWARVKTFLHDDHGINSFSFESETHVGESIVPILEGFLDKATFAILVLTAEDETSEGTIRARQNVIHEAGLFQGKLGFKKVILLNQQGLDNFSNVDGLQYIGFSGDDIEQTFYQIQRVLKREGII